MDSVLMTSPGNSTRIKSRLRNAAASFLARNSKNRHVNKNIANNKNNRLANLKHNGNLRQVNNYNRNINGNHESTSCAANNNGNATNSTSKNHQNNVYKGTFTREVYSTICGRLGHTSHIPGDWVQTLFNDMHLYPSKSQVSEMLQCARQCGRRNGTTPFLTFGEFCVFAREMQKPKLHRKVQLQSKREKNCEVFLGGSCNPTTWRTDIAIPELQKHGITYYNPQRSIWGPELVAEEHDAKQSASVLLFVLDSQTRSVAGMIEVAYLVASDRCVVVVAHPYELGQSIMGEELSYREYTDLVSGQSTLLTLLSSQGIKVYSNLMSALHRTTSMLDSTRNGKAEDLLANKLRKLKETFDLYDVNATGELQLNDVLDAYYRLTKKSLQISDLYNYLSNLNIEKKNILITFDQFCALVAEFSVENCTTINDGRIFRLLYWRSTLLKTQHLIRMFLVQPLNLALDWASQPLQRQCSTNNNSHCDTNNAHANCNSNERDVYLGGSLSTESRWREDTAIPLLKKHGLTYYNPAMREDNVEITNGCLDRDNENLLQWKDEIDKSRVLLFMVTSDTKSLTTMILAAHYIGLGKSNIVLCIEALPSADSQMGDEELTTQAIKDYNRGRVYLSDVAKRRKIPVFENITEAVQCAISKCQER